MRTTVITRTTPGSEAGAWWQKTYLEGESMKRLAVVLQGTLEVIETDGGRLPPAILIGDEDLGDEVVRLCRLDKLELSRGVDGVAPGKWILTLVKYA